MSLAAGSSLPLRDGAPRFLDAYGAVAQPLAHRLHTAYWDFSCSGESQHQDVIRDCEETFSDLHSSLEIFERICGWLEDDDLSPDERRQLELLRREYRRSKAPDALRKRIIRLSLKVEETTSIFRPELNGRRINSNELDRILLHEQDEQLRHEAWTATRQVGARIVDTSLELVRLRNELAGHLGFDNYFALAVDDEEMDLDFVDRILNELRTLSEPAWKDCRDKIEAQIAAQRGKSVDELMPWDYPERFFQALPRSNPDLSIDSWFQPTTIRRYTTQFFRRIGLDIEGLWEASDMMPRDGKYPHAFCIGIDNPTDVRVLCNLDGTTRWMDTTLHEFGHAIYNRHIDGELPWLLREAAHTFVTEAVAMYFGRHARDPQWLQEIAGVPQEQTARVDGLVKEGQLVFSRWALLVTLFERQMYADPEQDLGALWWGLAEDLQGLRRPEGHDLPDWASKVHIPCYPAYYQNYIYGELLASQFRDCITGEGDNDDAALSPDVGSFFRPLFQSGRRLGWVETVRQATGRDLDTSSWLREFAGAASSGGAA